MTAESFLDGRVTLHTGDARERLKDIPDNSVDSCVTDPPYALVSIVERFGKEGAAPVDAGKHGAYARASAGFMGKEWDTGETAFDPAFWREVYRVLKPGAHLAAFGGTRSYHRLACAIEDAGFEIRDQIAWVYGSGFPKSHDVSKGIDRAAGATREVVGDKLDRPGYHLNGHDGGEAFGSGLSSSTPDTRLKSAQITAPATPESAQWSGWGTALKPSQENICIASKPYTNEQEFLIIGSTLLQLWSRLWLMLSAKDAESLSTLNPSACGADVSAFAQWSAEQPSSTRAALCDQMDMSLFESALISSLNTVSSWSATWAGLSTLGSMSIIETELRPTIDLRTLRLCLSRITPESIIAAHESGVWLNACADSAANLFNAAAMKLSATLTLSVAASASDLDAIRFPAVDEKIGLEPICLARKPLIGTVAANVLQHGTGAINVDGCRISTDGPSPSIDRRKGNVNFLSQRSAKDAEADGKIENRSSPEAYKAQRAGEELGRFPANLVHDGSPEVLAAFPDSTSGTGAVKRSESNSASIGAESRPVGTVMISHGDSGSAARFFYTAKADADDRLGFNHPTVKPVDLMQWLVRLVTPKGGLVLDPFAGTGTTGEAAYREKFNAILIERDEGYQGFIRQRMAMVTASRRERKTAHVKGRKKVLDAGPLFGES